VFARPINVGSVKEKQASVLPILGNLFEWLIHYLLFGVIVALLLMLILLALLYARYHVAAYLPLDFLRDKFDQLCALSDRLDENRTSSNPFASALWLTRLILMAFGAAAGLMILWIIVLTVRG
jgi:hypothetical protein